MREKFAEPALDSFPTMRRMTEPTFDRGNVFGYEGRRVLVTGAASGMGEATARLLGSLGAEVHVLDVRKPSIPNEAFYEVDLRDRSAIDDAVAAVTSGGRTLDRHFNCAGISQLFPPVDVMLVNFVGLRHLTESLIPSIVRGGAIASISSGAGLGYLMNMGTVGELLAVTDYDEARSWCEANPEKIREGYSFSKECIIVWTMTNAIRLAQENKLRINCIGPGPTDTAFMPAVLEQMGQEYFDAFPTPLLYLNSDVAAVITGTNTWTDQGFAAGAMTGTIDLAALMPSPE
jgi:NAD(P)-dependent dehydrogenase (short-subunit alcohol dehydrogenase family)